MVVNRIQRAFVDIGYNSEPIIYGNNNKSVGLLFGHDDNGNKYINYMNCKNIMIYGWHFFNHIVIYIDFGGTTHFIKWNNDNWDNDLFQQPWAPFTNYIIFKTYGEVDEGF